MLNLSAEERQSNLESFKRRRQYELLIGALVVVGTVTLVMLFKDPRLEIYGHGGVELALAAAGVIAVGVALHVVNWRCPHCHRFLERLVGGAPICRNCGPLFNPEGTAKATSKRTLKADLTPAERALKKEMQRYDGRTALRLFRGIIVLCGGLAFAIWAGPSDDAPHPELWLYRTFGPRGLIVGAKVFGIVIILFGVWMLVTVGRRMRW